MAERPKKRDLHGWLVLDKPLGMSSTQALAKARWLLGAAKAGHGGTLDPLASGVLPLAFGEATKTVNWVLDGDKTYQFTVQWGCETSTDDLEGNIVSTSNKLLESIENNELENITRYVASQHKLCEVISQFLGSIRQTPPAYSAIKIGGKRAYDLARRGESPEMAARAVFIHDLRVLDWPTPTSTRFAVRCGKGTYVRSLARDLGRATGWLGHVTELRRTAAGPFDEAQAISLEKLEELCHRTPRENSLIGLLRPIETVLDGIPALAVMEAEAKRLQQGQRVLLPEGETPREAEAVLITHDGRPLGIFRVEGGVLKAIRVFNLDARS